MPRFICYTDGSYQASVKAGGWSSIILNEKEEVVDILYQGFTHTTNNRMELRAVLETLRHFKVPTEIEIISDSQYVVNSIVEGSAEKWVMDSDTSKRNFDLWFEIVDLLHFHKVTFRWVKGHNGNKWNEEADKWCTFAAQCYNIPRDIWTIQSKQKSLEETGT